MINISQLKEIGEMKGYKVEEFFLYKKVGEYEICIEVMIGFIKVALYKNNIYVEERDFISYGDDFKYVFEAAAAIENQIKKQIKKQKKVKA